jgi:nucleoid DNA-binding protein
MAKAKVVTKSELVEAIAKTAKQSKKEAATFLNSFVEAVEENLKKGNKIRLIPFGSFEVRERKARTGRNPRTGAKIKIKGRKVPVFKPGKGLKSVVK